MAKHKRKRRIGNSLTGKLLVVLLASVVILGAAVWGVNARYVHRGGGQGIVKAKEFYFTSDYLTPANPRYTLNPGTTEVTFELRNYDGLKVSELDISFSVKKDGVDVLAGTIPTGEARSQEVTLKDLMPGSYTVTATGSNGYSRTISATFEVKAPVEGIYKHTQIYADHVILTVWTQGISGTAAVTVSEGLIPDYTDSNLKGKSAGETLTVTLNENESVSYRFFTAGGYNKQPVTVTVNGEALDETALS